MAAPRAQSGRQLGPKVTALFSYPRELPQAGNHSTKKKRSFLKNLSQKVSAVDKTVKLVNLNPIKLVKSIQMFVRDVRGVKRCRDGTLIVTAVDE